MINKYVGVFFRTAKELFYKSLNVCQSMNVMLIKDLHLWISMPRSESLSELHSHVRKPLDCYTSLSYKNYTTNKEISLDIQKNEQRLWFS